MAGAAVLILRTLAAGSLQGPTERVEPANKTESALQSKTLPEIAVPAPTATNRVTAAARIYLDTASPGDTVTLLVRVRVAPGHYIYALEKAGNSNLPTTLETEHTGILRADGAWRGPEPKTKEDGSRMHSGDLLFQRRFQIERGAAIRSWKIPIKLTYQVCNEALCWPPAIISLETPLKIVGSR